MEGCGGFSWVHFNLNVPVVHDHLKKKINSKVLSKFLLASLLSSFKVFNWLPFLVLHTWLNVAVTWNRSRCTSCKDYLRITCFLTCSNMWTVKRISLSISVALVWLHSLDYDFSVLLFLCCLYMTKVWIIWIPNTFLLWSLSQVIRFCNSKFPIETYKENSVVLGLYLFVFLHITVVNADSLSMLVVGTIV